MMLASPSSSKNRPCLNRYSIQQAKKLKIKGRSKKVNRTIETILTRLNAFTSPTAKVANLKYKPSQAKKG
ncbi:hypothetical protein SLEP1_g59526 [Rubroshorea leprosula]|uniref:Uncharacterized protein n=1 Tax=Rubroshorea leprosula TaxID=152421 RepID=A0AAV5MSK5_9ROSI|nr:hypothetical protein SLEP1_g59526 [Rubroshorea leprosula]